MTYDHYKKDVRHLEMIDVYRVIELFGVTHPALQHALKKVLCAGDRGAKDWEKDVKEAIDSLNRALEMRAEDAGVKLTEEEALLMVYPALDAGMLTPKTRCDPHAELRKTWEPGQRWQFRWRHLMEDWREVSQESSPRWASSCEYRRHPDDAKEGHD